MSVKDCSCLLPWDTNKSIKATFNFLKSRQLNDDGSISTTLLFLGISSLSNINLENYTERNLAYNLIEGTISEVLDNSVVLSVQYKCAKTPFVVAYSDIQNIQSDVFIKYQNEYIDYLNLLPPLCKCDGNRYYDILNALTTSLNNNPKFKIVLIYSGIFSRKYMVSDIAVTKNLILFNNAVLPVTQLMGYFLTPSITEDAKEEK